MRAIKNHPPRNSNIEIEASDGSVQHLPPDHAQRFEGIAFSASGNIIGAASSITNAVFLYRRNADGRFEDTRCLHNQRTRQKLIYPHDVAFAPAGKTAMGKGDANLFLDEISCFKKRPRCLGERASLRVNWFNRLEFYLNCEALPL